MQKLIHNFTGSSPNIELQLLHILLNLHSFFTKVAFHDFDGISVHSETYSIIDFAMLEANLVSKINNLSFVVLRTVSKACIIYLSLLKPCKLSAFPKWINIFGHLPPSGELLFLQQIDSNLLVYAIVVRLLRMFCPVSIVLLLKKCKLSFHRNPVPIFTIRYFQIRAENGFSHSNYRAFCWLGAFWFIWSWTCSNTLQNFVENPIFSIVSFPFT